MQALVLVLAGNIYPTVWGRPAVMRELRAHGGANNFARMENTL